MKTRGNKVGIRTWLLSGILMASVAILSPLSPTARAAEPIKIGFSMALTGGLAGAGKAALIAMEIWREDTNKAGGLLECAAYAE